MHDRVCALLACHNCDLVLLFLRMQQPCVNGACLFDSYLLSCSCRDKYTLLGDKVCEAASDLSRESH